MRNPVPEVTPFGPETEIRAIAGALPEKIEPFIFSLLLTPLQKHQESNITPIPSLYLSEMGLCWIWKKD